MLAGGVANTGWTNEARRVSLEVRRAKAAARAASGKGAKKGAARGGDDKGAGDREEMFRDQREWTGSGFVENWYPTGDDGREADPHWGRVSREAPYGYVDGTDTPRKEPIYDRYGRPIIPRDSSAEGYRQGFMDWLEHGPDTGIDGLTAQWLAASKKAEREWGRFGVRQKYLAANPSAPNVAWEDFDAAKLKRGVEDIGTVVSPLEVLERQFAAGRPRPFKKVEDAFPASALEFDEKRHEYKVNGVYKPGVTALIEADPEYSFNQEAVAADVARRRTKAGGRTVSRADVLAEWDARRAGGTAVHAKIEAALRSPEAPAEPWVEEIRKQVLKGASGPVIAELPVWGKSFAGRADILVPVGDRTYDIYDAKTSSFNPHTGTTTNFQGDVESKYETAVAQGKVSRKEHVRLQLFAYTVALKEQGFNVRNAYVIPVPAEGGGLHRGAGGGFLVDVKPTLQTVRAYNRIFAGEPASTPYVVPDSDGRRGGRRGPNVRMMESRELSEWSRKERARVREEMGQRGSK